MQSNGVINVITALLPINPKAASRSPVAAIVRIVRAFDMEGSFGNDVNYRVYATHFDMRDNPDRGQGGDEG